MIKELFEIYLRNNGYRIAPGTNHRVNEQGFDIKAHDETNISYYITVIEDRKPALDNPPIEGLSQKISLITNTMGSADSSPNYRYIIVFPDTPAYRKTLEQEPLWITGQIKAYSVTNDKRIIDIQEDSINKTIDTDGFFPG